MLRIPRRQQDALCEAQVADFERRAAVHLRSYFAEDIQALDDSALRQLIRHGIDRAAGFGVVAERDVTLYLDVMVTLGPDFDRDPTLPWAYEILVEPELPEPARRMRRLFRATLAHVEGTR
jgi:hypothetical protein